MPIPKITGFFDRSNYSDLSGGNENLSIAGAKLSSSIGTFSAGLGFDIKDSYVKQTHSKELAGEIKYKSPSLNLTDNLSANIQCRGRFYQSGALQERVTLGINRKLGKNWSLYLQGHLTDKMTFGDQKNVHKWTTGGGLGVTYDNGKDFSVSAELWENFPIRGWSSDNAFPEGNLRSDFNCWEDENKMFNIIFSYRF